MDEETKALVLDALVLVEDAAIRLAANLKNKTAAPVLALHEKGSALRVKLGMPPFGTLNVAPPEEQPALPAPVAPAPTEG